MSGKKKMGRPRMSEDEKLDLVTLRLRPGDLEKLVASAGRRGMPTSSQIRDLLHALLVLADEPGAFARAGLAVWAVELGLDQEPDAGDPRTDAARPPGGRGGASGRIRVTGQPPRRARAS
jgi:hypothetical protein